MRPAYLMLLMLRDTNIRQRPLWTTSSTPRGIRAARVRHGSCLAAPGTNAFEERARSRWNHAVSGCGPRSTCYCLFKRWSRSPTTGVMSISCLDTFHTAVQPPCRFLCAVAHPVGQAKRELVSLGSAARAAENTRDSLKECLLGQCVTVHVTT